MKQVILELTWLDITFIALSLVSIAFNIVQFVQRRKMILPLKSALIGLFNDIKAKTLHAFTFQNVLFSPGNPHTTTRTLQWDYAGFTQTMINNLQGFQETVVSLLVSIDPSDREGKEAFRAANYGLTHEEKDLRKQTALQFLQQQQQTLPQPPQTPQPPNEGKAS